MGGEKLTVDVQAANAAWYEPAGTGTNGELHTPPAHTNPAGSMTAQGARGP
jgi:hypothetical protein